MSQENVEIVRRFYEAGNNEGLWAVAEFARPDVELVPPPDRPELPVLRGLERIPEIARQWAGALARQEWLREARRLGGAGWAGAATLFVRPKAKGVLWGH